MVVHECAHGIAAERAGDPTARMLGRITLNPGAAYRSGGLDPGADTCCWLTNSVDLFRLGQAGTGQPATISTEPRRDDIAVSIAGPISNILLALAFTVLLADGGQAAADRLRVLAQPVLPGVSLRDLDQPDPRLFQHDPDPAAGRFAHTGKSPALRGRPQVRGDLRPYGFFILIAAMYFKVLSEHLFPAGADAVPGFDDAGGSRRDVAREHE